SLDKSISQLCQYHRPIGRAMRPGTSSASATTPNPISYASGFLGTSSPSMHILLQGAEISR
ncbi:hypothetical protein FRC07_003809, partial [Ceratobasidium sp. 392]